MKSFKAKGKCLFSGRGSYPLFHMVQCATMYEKCNMNKDWSQFGYLNTK